MPRGGALPHVTLWLVERDTLYLLSMFTTVTLAIGYYNRHIHSGDGDTTHKNTYKYSLDIA